MYLCNSAEYATAMAQTALNDGILKYTDFENFSGRVNTSFNVNKLVTVCENLTISYTN